MSFAQLLPPCYWKENRPPNGWPKSLRKGNNRAFASPAHNYNNTITIGTLIHVKNFPSSDASDSKAASTICARWNNDVLHCSAECPLLAVSRPTPIQGCASLRTERAEYIGSGEIRSSPPNVCSNSRIIPMAPATASARRRRPPSSTGGTVSPSYSLVGGD
jgi:hypothetical protein